MMTATSPQRSLVTRRHKRLRSPRLATCLAFGLLLAAAPTRAAEMAKATFAGGCFWCMQPPFDGVDGVTSTRVGYIGGTTINPTYEEVSAGGTGHAEAIEVAFDPARVSYAQLLDIFWRNVDPLTANAQFCDRGSQYRSAIFYHDDNQRRIAEAARGDVLFWGSVS